MAAPTQPPSKKRKTDITSTAPPIDPNIQIAQLKAMLQQTKQKALKDHNGLVSSLKDLKAEKDKAVAAQNATVHHVTATNQTNENLRTQMAEMKANEMATKEANMRSDAQLRALQASTAQANDRANQQAEVAKQAAAQLRALKASEAQAIDRANQQAAVAKQAEANLRVLKKSEAKAAASAKQVDAAKLVSAQSSVQLNKADRMETDDDDDDMKSSIDFAALAEYCKTADLSVLEDTAPPSYEPSLEVSKVPFPFTRPLAHLDKKVHATPTQWMAAMWPITTQTAVSFAGVSAMAVSAKMFHHLAAIVKQENLAMQLDALVRFYLPAFDKAPNQFGFCHFANNDKNIRYISDRTRKLFFGRLLKSTASCSEFEQHAAFMLEMFGVEATAVSAVHVSQMAWDQSGALQPGILGYDFQDGGVVVVLCGKRNTLAFNSTEYCINRRNGNKNIDAVLDAEIDHSFDNEDAYTVVVVSSTPGSRRAIVSKQYIHRVDQKFTGGSFRMLIFGILREPNSAKRMNTTSPKV